MTGKIPNDLIDMVGRTQEIAEETRVEIASPGVWEIEGERIAGQAGIVRVHSVAYRRQPIAMAKNSGPKETLRAHLARFMEFCNTLRIGDRLEISSQTSAAPGSDEYVKTFLVALADQDLMELNFVDSSEAFVPAPINLRTQGPARAFKARAGQDFDKPVSPRQDTTEQACFRLLGYLPHGLWSQNVRSWRRPHGQAAADLEALMRLVLPHQMVQRLQSLCPAEASESARHRIGAGARVGAALQDWAAYVNGQDKRRPKRPPWAEDVRPSEQCKYTLYDSPYGYVTDLLNGVARASSDVTFVGVSFSVSVVEGRDQFLAALQNGASLRFLIFDFLNGDATEVAGALGLTPRELMLRCSETVEALKGLMDHELVKGRPSSVEVRLFTKEPGARWYIIDKDREQTGATFLYPRLARSLEGPAMYARNAESALMRDFGQRADDLWADAMPWPVWQARYRQWVQDAATDDEHPLRG